MLTQVIGIAFLAFSLTNAWKDSPKCTLACFHAAGKLTACDHSDFICLCSDSFLIGESIKCIQTECSPEDSQSTIRVSQEFCISKGTTFKIPSDVVLVSPSSTLPSSTTLMVPTTSTTSSDTSSPQHTKEAVSQGSNGAISQNVNVVTGILAFGLVALAI